MGWHCTLDPPMNELVSADSPRDDISFKRSLAQSSHSQSSTTAQSRGMIAVGNMLV